MSHNDTDAGEHTGFNGDVAGNDHRYHLIVPTTLVGGLISFLISWGVPFEQYPIGMTGNEVSIVITAIGAAASLIVSIYLSHLIGGRRTR